MSKETPKNDPRERTDWGSASQTDKPWKGNPEKEQRSGTQKSDPDEHALKGEPYGTRVIRDHRQPWRLARKP
jgi:hypothetical protein